MLQVKSLFVSFTKEYYTLNDISFELEKGQKLIIQGSKESGRTALIRTLVGLEPIAKGEIFYKNLPLEKVDFESDVSLGYIPAMPAFLDKKTVKQNIEYVLNLRKIESSLVVAKTNNALVEFGLDFIKNKKVKELSYFDKLKLALARLATRTLDVLLIDDIFTKLSTMEKEKISKMIKSIVKNNNCATLIMVDSEEVSRLFGYDVKYLVFGSLQDTPNVEEN